MENILEMAVESGIWAVLFVVLFFYQIKDSKIREEKYQDTISKLSRSLEIVADIDAKISEIQKVVIPTSAVKDEASSHPADCP